MKSVTCRLAVLASGAALWFAVSASAQDIGIVLSDTPNPAQISAAVARANPKIDRSPPKELKIKTYQKREMSRAAHERLKASKKIARDRGLDYIPDSYIVTFKKDVFPYVHKPSKGEEHLVDREGFTLAETADTLMSVIGGEVRYAFTSGDGAFSAVMTEEQAKTVAALPEIANVAKNRVGQFMSAPTWAQDRINQRSATRDYSYTTMNNGGAQVHIYIIDSGVRGTHQEFSGRVGNGVAVEFPGTPSLAYEDVAPWLEGHGTSVAGCAAGTTFGIAKNAIIHSVRVSDEFGDFGDDAVAAGIAWVRLNHLSPSVANISLGGYGSHDLIDTETQALYDAGVTVIASAGNESVYVSPSPAHVEDIITVGATDAQDKIASFSNYGLALDVFAPGVGIEMPIGTGDAAMSTRNGTSFASPIVAGIAALYLKGHPSATPEAVGNAIKANSTRNVVTGIPSDQTTKRDIAYANPDWLDVDRIILGGSGTVVGTNIAHPNGNVYDQVLLTGAAVTVHPDNNQVVRCSWIDEDDDIVMAELAGPGNLKIELENASGPALPVNYNQAVYYMKGRATFQILGATSATYFNVFSIGRANAVNQSLFLPVYYDGIADIKSLNFFDTASIGGILNGNAVYQGNSGTVGIDNDWSYFSGVRVTNKLIIRDIKASGSATPILVLSPSSQYLDFGGKPVIAAGDLIQPNGARIAIKYNSNPGFSALITNANVDSHGNTAPPLPLSSARLGSLYGSTIYPMPYSTTDALNYTPPPPGTTSAY